MSKQDENAVQDEVVLAEMETSTEDSQPEMSEEVQEESTIEVETQEEPKIEDQDEEVEVIVEDDEPKEDTGSSLEKDEKPFNERPEFKQRITQIEEKYGAKAQTLDTLMESAKKDPDYYLKTVKMLEEAGKFPSGTYDIAKKQVEQSKKEEKKEAVKHEKEIDKEVLERPEIQYAKKLYEEDRAKREEFLENYERKHPEIAQSENPAEARQMIATLTKGLQKRGLSEEVAMENAFVYLFGDKEAIAKVAEQTKLEAKYQAEQDSVMKTMTPTNAPTKKTIRMTAEQKNAADSLGMGYKEYMKFSQEDSGMVD